jgi:hypothetical protein
MVHPMTMLPVNVRIFVPPQLADVSAAHAVRRFSSCQHPHGRTIPYFTVPVHGKTVAV